MTAFHSFFITEWYSIVCVCVCVYMCVCVCVCIPYLLYPFIGRWTLGPFHNLAIVDSTAINIGVPVPLESALLYPWDKFLVMQLLGCKVVLFLIF